MPALITADMDCDGSREGRLKRRGDLAKVEGENDEGIQGPVLLVRKYPHDYQVIEKVEYVDELHPQHNEAGVPEKFVMEHPFKNVSRHGRLLSVAGEIPEMSEYLFPSAEKEFQVVPVPDAQRLMPEEKRIESDGI